MEANTVLVVVAVVVGGAAGSVLGRRSLRERTRGLERASLDASAALRSQAQEAHDDRAIQDQILRSMQEGILLFDAGGATMFANDAVVGHLGARPGTLSQVFPVGIREAVTGAVGDGATRIAEVETGTPTRWLRVTATPTGVDATVLVVVTDVTEARRLDAVRRDFVANASHELKTPAASIQAAAETLLHAWRDDPDAVPRFAEQLDREAVRLSRIVADLLDLSRLESGSDLDDRVRLDAIVREEGQRFEEAAHEAGLVVDVDAAAVPPIRGSARDLSLLVRNLFDNAIRYSRAGGTVHAEVFEDGTTVVLRVKDTGIGIPTKELPRVFERFYRVDRARSRETGGTGLGLAIVRHVAENHGGEVTVESELGQGTTFEVRLPATWADAPEPARS